MKTGRQGRRGQTLIEFALIFTIFWIPLLLGLLFVGTQLIQHLQVTQLARDVGHMYSRSVDFTKDTSKTLIVNMANQGTFGGLNMTLTGGRATIILSKIQYNDKTACSPSGSESCANLEQWVLRQRIVIGNSAIKSHYVADPPTTMTDSDTHTTVKDYYYLTDSNLVLRDFSTKKNLTIESEDGSFPGIPAGAAMYLVEVYSNSLGTSEVMNTASYVDLIF